MAGTPIQLLREDWGDLFDRSIRAISSAASFTIQFVELIGEPDQSQKVCTKYVSEDMDIVQHMHVNKIDPYPMSKIIRGSHAHLE